MNDVVRRVEVTGKSTGLENLKAKLQGVAQAQDGVAVSADQMSHAAGSVDSRLNRLQRSLDPTYRAAQSLETAQRTLNQALDQGAITVERHAALMELAESKYNANTSAARANAAAQNAMASATRSAALSQRMLFPQLLQIGQAAPLAFQAPLAFMQQFAFQSADIAQIYAGRGGVTAAIQDSATMVGRLTARLGPLAIATGLVGAGFIGLRDDIRETTGETVTFGNVMRATLDEIVGGISTRAAPAVAWLKEDFSKLSTAIIEDVRMGGDLMINGFEAAYNTVAATWNRLPELFGHLMYSAANSVLDGLNQLIQMGINDINAFIGAYNQVPVLPDLDRLGSFERFSIENPFADGIGADLNQIYTDAFSDSPMTEAFDRIGIGAAELARSASDAAFGVDRVGEAARAVGPPLDLMGAGLRATNDNLQSMTGIVAVAMNTFNSTLQQTGSFFDAAKAAGTSFLQSISQQLTEIASRNLVQAAFGGLGGLGGNAGLLGGLIPGFANGTDYAPGGLAMVGERGPELVNLPRGSQVIPNHQLMAANNNAPAPIVIHQTVNVSGTIGGAEIARAIDEGNQFVLSQVDGRSVRAISTVNRTKPGLIG